MAKWTLPEPKTAEPIETAMVPIKRYPDGKGAPLFFHERVGEGDYKGETFEVIRGVDGACFQMHVRMKDETVAFNIYDVVQQIVTGEQPPAADGRPCNTDLFLVHVKKYEDDHFDLEQRIDDWLHGDWNAALDGLPDLGA